MRRVVTSGSLDGVMVSTVAQNARDVVLIPALNIIFLILITAMTLVAMAMILYWLYVAWLLNLTCVCLCDVTAYM